MSHELALRQPGLSRASPRPRSPTSTPSARSADCLPAERARLIGSPPYREHPLPAACTRMHCPGSRMVVVKRAATRRRRAAACFSRGSLSLSYVLLGGRGRPLRQRGRAVADRNRPRRLFASAHGPLRAVFRPAALPRLRRWRSGLHGTNALGRRSTPVSPRKSWPGIRRPRRRSGRGCSRRGDLTRGAPRPCALTGSLHAREIGRELCLGVNTVKTQCGVAIYRKLAFARGRTQSPGARRLNLSPTRVPRPPARHS